MATKTQKALDRLSALAWNSARARYGIAWPNMNRMQQQAAVSYELCLTIRENAENPGYARAARLITNAFIPFETE